MIKFRFPLYITLYIEEGEKGLTLEQARAKAQEQADKLTKDIPNSYPGEVKTMNELIQGGADGK